MKYFVIGERELVLAFGLVGVAGAVAVNRAEALDAFMRITGRGGTPSMSEQAKVLILAEDVSVLIEDEVLEWQRQGQYPLIVEIPGLHGHLEGKKTLTDAIREAIGIHV